MRTARRGLSNTDQARIRELFLEKVAYHEAGHAVCMIHCGIPVQGIYLYPTTMPKGSPSTLGCCVSDVQNHEIQQMLFSCAGACFGEEWAPGIREMRLIAAEHPLRLVRRDVKQMLNSARVEYNALLLQIAKSMAGQFGITVPRMRIVLKEDWEPEYETFCSSLEFAAAVQELAALLMATKKITSKRILSGRFLKVPVLARPTKSSSPLSNLSQPIPLFISDELDSPD